MLWFALSLLLPMRGDCALLPTPRFRLPGADFVSSIDLAFSVAPSPFAIAQTFPPEVFRARDKPATRSVVLQLASYTASDLATRLRDYAVSASDNAVMLSFTQSALGKAGSVRLVAFGTSAALERWIRNTMRNGDRVVSSDNEELRKAFT